MPLPISIPMAVTFDCWQTLMVEVDSAPAREARIEALGGKVGKPYDPTAYPEKYS